MIVEKKIINKEKFPYAYRWLSEDQIDYKDVKTAIHIQKIILGTESDSFLLWIFENKNL